MKKYRLIKRYPGSPKLGFVIENGYYCDQLYINPKDYPDNWELVVEKDYEILSFLFYGNTLFENVNGKFNGYNEKSILYDKKHLIHSIKRLSDGEIFTIGDYINIHSNNPCCERGTIVDFLFITDINNISHVKQPLFTTEDGVDIFEGNTFYFIPQNFYGNSPGKLIAKLGVLAEFAKARFSTKEKAEEYIFMNKPCLLLQDILNTNHYAPIFMEQIRNLVKHKLK